MTDTILLVDDDAAVLDGLRRSARGEQWQVRTAEDADAALLRLGEGPVGAIVLDDRMPGLPGVELLPILREQHPGIPVIMLSGGTTVGNVLHAFNRGGAFRFLTKPCPAVEVMAVIREALEYRRAMLTLRDVVMQAVPGLPGRALPAPDVASLARHLMASGRLRSS